MQRSIATNKALVIEKPKKTYIELINEAFDASNQNPLNSREICQYIAKEYPFYDLNDDIWQKGVFCNLSKRTYFRPIDKMNKSETLKYVPIDQEPLDESFDENKLNVLRAQIKWTEDECKKAKEALERQREQHQNHIDEMRYEYQVKLAQIDNEIRMINEMIAE